MILYLLAAAAASPPADERFAACVALSEKDASAALRQAESWRLEGGGIPARQCLGIAYAAQRRWLPAAAAFEAAARDAERNRDGRAARLWVQAGNAYLAAGDAAKARGALDTALASGSLAGPEAGEAHLDRARALATLKSFAGARSDIDAALKLVPADPLGWLLSATLARKMGQLERAATDIAEAARLSPDDAMVALEAGNIALLNGAPEAARTAWTAAVRNAPQSEAGKSAAEALKQFEAAPPR